MVVGCGDQAKGPVSSRLEHCVSQLNPRVAKVEGLSVKFQFNGEFWGVLNQSFLCISLLVWRPFGSRFDCVHLQIWCWNFVCLWFSSLLGHLGSCHFVRTFNSTSLICSSVMNRRFLQSKTFKSPFLRQ